MPDVLNVWIIAGRDGYTIDDETYELLTEANNLGEQQDCVVSAILLGSDLEASIDDITASGLADFIYAFESPHLKPYTPYIHLSTIKKIARELHPDIVLFSATSKGKDLAPRLAHKLGVGFISNIQEIRFTPDLEVEIVKPMYGDKVHGHFRFTGPPPHIVSIIPGVVGVKKSRGLRQAKIIKSKDFEVFIKEMPSSYRVTGFIKADPKTMDISEAEVIAAGGRGVNGKEGFKTLEAFATLIGGAVGCTRPIVDEGILPLERQIGQTGKTVNPDLFLSCGISGVIQHEMGMKDSKHIIAINNDHNAQVFRISDLKVITDINELLPRLIEEIRQYKNEMDRNE